MSHPTREQVEKAVKLWRCNMTHVCPVLDCVHRVDVPAKSSELKHASPGCSEELFCDSSNMYSKCVIVGFRTPHPGCGSCANWDLCDRSDDWKSVCDPCRADGYSRWTPRQPGKGGA